MTISDMQEKYEGTAAYATNMLATMDRQLKNGREDEASYNAQLALVYSVVKDADKCRHYAALVPLEAKPRFKALKCAAVARMLVYEHKISEAIELYKEAISYEPENESSLEELGWCHFEQQNFAEAEKCFRMAIEVEPEYFLFWQGLGLATAQLNNHSEAIEYFTKAIELDEYKVELCHNEFLIGLCYGNMNDFYRALSHYTKSLDADPSYAHALNNMAALYFNHEADVKPAIDYLKKAEAIGDETKDKYLLQLVYINLSRLYTRIKEFDLQELYTNKLLCLLGFMMEMDEE